MATAAQGMRSAGAGLARVPLLFFGSLMFGCESSEQLAGARDYWLRELRQSGEAYPFGGWWHRIVLREVLAAHVACQAAGVWL